MAFTFFGSGASIPKLSKYFSLADLTKTSIAAPNIPNAEETANLRKLASVGDMLYDRVGPFRWESAFRSQAVQDKLKAGAGGASAASQAATKSYHSLGMAGDIQPTSMTAEAFFAKIAADSGLKNLLGEIALKNNVLHISLATPTKQGVLMFVDKAGSYIRYKAEEVAAILKKYQKQVAIGGGAIVLIGLGIFLFLKMRKK